MEFTLPKATLSITLLIVIISAVDARNYLAFPRMGRSGFLAFPRMGRSFSKTVTADDITSSQDSGDCCGIGLKSEFSVNEEGKEEVQSVCTASVSVCCDGLREYADEKPDGTVYSMCIPDVVNVYPSAINKLKSILSSQ